MDEPSCPECRVAMVSGHLLDRSKARIHTVIWASGPADWVGPVGFSLNSKLKGPRVQHHDVYEVISYRCPQCGRLASFARTSARPNE